MILSLRGRLALQVGSDCSRQHSTYVTQRDPILPGISVRCVSRHQPSNVSMSTRLSWPSSVPSVDTTKSLVLSLLPPDKVRLPTPQVGVPPTMIKTVTRVAAVVAVWCSRVSFGIRDDDFVEAGCNDLWACRNAMTFVWSARAGSGRQLCERSLRSRVGTRRLQQD